MKLAVVAMVRNESDIIGGFLQHLDALFDYALLMDHGSIDGTDRTLTDACEQRPGWTMWRIDAVGYHQARFSRFAAQHMLRNTDADFVLFLDADEFIAVADRAALDRALAPLTDPDRVGILQWRNVVPDRLDARAFRLNEPVWRGPTRSQFGKVIIPRLFYQRHWNEAHLSVGNHSLYYTLENLVPMDLVGEILHLPVRSHAQLGQKVLAGVFSNMAQIGRNPAQCQHWFNILFRIADGMLSDDDLFGLATHYGAPESASTPTSRAELAQRGFVLTPLAVAAGRDMGGTGEPTWINPVRLVATILRNFQPEDLRNKALVLDGNRLHFVTQTATPV
jgi:hypothetical protein